MTDGGTHEGNFVGNYYKPGPGSPSEITYALKAQVLRHRVKAYLDQAANSRLQYEDGLPGTQQYHCNGNSMEGVYDQDSEQFSGDGTGATSNIACWADVTIDPAPSYQKFFDEP